MAYPVKLALLATIIGSWTQAELQSPKPTGGGSENESVLTKLIKLEHRITECLIDVKSQLYELQQKALNDQSKTLTANGQSCPCNGDSTTDNNSIASCKDLKPKASSGQYLVTVSDTKFKVYCEQELDGGGWTVIQNRYDGSVEFFRNWDDYRNGFGDLNGEFWLGLEKIHLLTSSRDHELIVRVEDFNGNKADARYSKFAISGEDDQYRLTVADFAKGKSGLSAHVNRKFSTYDKDNDSQFDKNCAELAQSGWWHNCYEWSNLNGKYQNGYHGDGNYSSLMTWWTFRGYNGLKTSKMMIRGV